MEFIRKHRTSVILLIIHVLSSVLYQYVNRPIGQVRVLLHPLDAMIPLVPAFIIIYHSWYPFKLSGFWQIFKRNEALYQQMIIHLLVGQAVAITIFVLYQTKVIRPVITGQDIFSRLVAWTYQIDNPYNALPSIHVQTTLIVLYYYVRVYKKEIARILLFGLYSGLIIASTLLVKQHMFWDLPAALVVALVTYFPAKWIFQYPFVRWTRAKTIENTRSI